MPDLRLHEIRDEHFAWLLGECGPSDGLTEAPGGVDDRFVISLLRDLTAALHRAGCRGHWLIIDGMEVVGLCGFKRLPMRRAKSRSAMASPGVAADEDTHLEQCRSWWTEAATRGRRHSRWKRPSPTSLRGACSSGTGSSAPRYGMTKRTMT